MQQILPEHYLENLPCLIVAVTSALGNRPDEIPVLKENGYATLKIANTYIRDSLKVNKRINYYRQNRPRLKDLHIDGRAIVCVLGHFLYLDHEFYYSFFDNEEDDVVSVWVLKE